MVLLRVWAVLRCIRIVLGWIMDGGLQRARPKVEGIIFRFCVPIAAGEPGCCP